MAKQENPNAFPCDFQHTGYSMQYGMTLRDYFAAKAMQAYIEVTSKDSEKEFHPSYDEYIALSAYETADAMLKERGK